MSALRNLAVVVAAYVIAWAAAFFSIVGFQPELMPSYFVWGWSFSGGELATTVWLLTWPILVGILLTWALVGRTRRGRQP